MVASLLFQAVLLWTLDPLRRRPMGIAMPNGGFDRGSVSDRYRGGIWLEGNGLMSDG